jgi:hypothetical protein
MAEGGGVEYHITMIRIFYRGSDKSLAIIGGILVLFMYITRLASNEIFSPSNKIHRDVGRAKDLSALR